MIVVLFLRIFQLRVEMSKPSNQWYVEMSAGITLGPMPFDTVVELAETSAIMRDDRVREESSKEWKSAHQVSGLFSDEGSLSSDSGVVSLSGFEVAKPADESTTGKPLKSEEFTPAPAVTDGVVRLDGFEVLLGESETTSSDDVDDAASVLLRAAASLETAESTPAPPRAVKPKNSVEGGQGEASKLSHRLDIPDDVIPQLDVPQPTPFSVSPPEPDPSRTLDVPEKSPISTEPESTVVDTRDAPPLPDLGALVSEGVEDGAVPAPQISAAAPPQLKPTIQPWRPPTNRVKQLAVPGCLAFAAVIGVWSLVSLLTPDMEVATYDQYASIYQEYQTFAELPDSGSWSEFATRAKADLDATLPDLEAVAVPGERSKSLLLYAGRDLRTALDLTPGVDNPHAERLAGFFDQLNELHSSSD
jgi:hypothetical protein